MTERRDLYEWNIYGKTPLAIEYAKDPREIFFSSSFFFSGFMSWLLSCVVVLGEKALCQIEKYCVMRLVYNLEMVWNFVKWVLKVEGFLWEQDKCKKKALESQC